MRSNSTLPAKKRRKQVPIACIICAKAKAACSDTRPCDRCVRLAKQDQCVDSADVRARWWSERSSEELAELPTSTKRSRAARSGFGWQDTSFFNSSHYQLPKNVACFACNKAKARCNGRRPCSRCLDRGLECCNLKDSPASGASGNGEEGAAVSEASGGGALSFKQEPGSWAGVVEAGAGRAEAEAASAGLTTGGSAVGQSGELPAPPELLVGLVAGVEPTAKGWGGRSLMERGYGMPGVVGSLVMQEAVRAGGAAGWSRQEQTRGLELTSGQSVGGWGMGGGILSRATLAGGGRGEMMASWRGEREGQRWQEELRPGAEAGLLSLGMVGRSGWPRGDGGVGEQRLSSEATERLLRRGMEAIAAGREQETTLRAEMAGRDQPGRMQVRVRVRVRVLREREEGGGG